MPWRKDLPKPIYDHPARIPSVPLREQPLKYASLVWLLAIASALFMSWAAYGVIGEILQQLGSLRYP